MKLRIAGLEKESITDGFGFRYTIFTQGCPHGCPGCHNPESHDPAAGRDVHIKELFEEFLQNPLLKGITFSGGEPFCQPKPLLALAKLVHSAGKDVTVYSGWTYEELLQSKSPEIKALLNEADILVDGRYEEGLRNLELRFRGSENQRVIDLRRTREAGSLILAEL